MKRNGFSLVELSVVLIILGLLAAGITAGNSLVKGAKLRSVIADIENFKTSISSFVLQYDALPGDMTNAHDYWDDGANGVCGSPGNCNGNGNEEIAWGSGPNSNESLRAWQHLNLAGILPGNYTGSGNVAIPGTNVPASKIIGGGYTIRLLQWPAVFHKRANEIEFGASVTNSLTRDSILIPADAHSIDKKIDDANPEYGNVGATLGNNGGAPNNCTVGGTGSITYKLSYSDIACRMFFVID